METVLFVFCKDLLLDFDFCADSFELSLESLCIFLGNAFLDLGVLGLDKSLCFCKAEAGDCTDFLDDLDLLGAELGEDNVELGLLFYDRAATAAAETPKVSSSA